MKTNKRSYLFAVLAVLLMAFAVVPSGAETVYAEGSEVEIGALKYWIYSDGTAGVGGWAANNTDEELTIPASVEYGSKTYKVTEIGGNAFQNDTKITTLTVGAGIQIINSWAFDGCTNLKDITLPDTLTSIGRDAFYNTAYYKKQDNWESDVLYIGNYLIKGETGGEYTVKDGTKLIADGAFISRGISKIMIPASVERIGQEAFMLCENLSQVTFEAGSCLKHIGVDAFNDCLSLISINLPESVTEIGASAFCHTGFTSIVLPEGLECIRGGTFFNCSNLTEVTIPWTVKVIEEGAFNNTPLTTIHFGGTNAEWDAITGEGKPMNIVPMDFGPERYNITVSAEEADVTLNKKRAPANEEVIVTCRTHPGYDYKSVKVTGPAGEIDRHQIEADTGGLYKFYFIMPAGAVKVTVQTEPKTAEVSFDKNGGSGTMDPVDMTTGDPAPECEFMPPEEKRFKKWNTRADGKGASYKPGDHVKVELDGMTLYAIWEDLPKYTVTFDDGNGKTLKTEIVADGNAATAPEEPTREGYVFKGWDKDFKNITDNTTVKAQWAKLYTVTFMDGQGKTLKTETVESGKAATAPEEPTREGYVFKGWDKAFNKITEDTTVTAQWEKAADPETKPASESETDPAAAPVSIKDAKVLLSAESFKYTGKIRKPVIRTIDGKALKEGTDYTAKWSNEKSKNAGTYTITITGKGGYTGTTKAAYKITKAANPLKIKGNTARIKYSKLSKKDQTLAVKKVIKVTKKGKGKLTYKKASGSKKITINKKTGKVTVKKGLKAGKYKVKVTVKAAGNKNYNASKAKKATFTIVVQ